MHFRVISSGFSFVTEKLEPTEQNEFQILILYRKNIKLISSGPVYKQIQYITIQHYLMPISLTITVINTKFTLKKLDQKIVLTHF